MTVASTYLQEIIKEEDRKIASAENIFQLASLIAIDKNGDPDICPISAGEILIKGNDGMLFCVPSSCCTSRMLLRQRKGMITFAAYGAHVAIRFSAEYLGREVAGDFSLDIFRAKIEDSKVDSLRPTQLLQPAQFRVNDLCETRLRWQKQRELMCKADH